MKSWTESATGEIGVTVLKKMLRDRDGRPTLFDMSVRRFAGPREHGEKAYQFYDRVEGRLWDDHREFVDRCFRGLPRQERAQVAGQWRGGQDDQLAASWWEMLLHETLVSSGAEMMAHVPSGAGTRADFHVVLPDSSAFYLEAHRLGPSAEQRAHAERREHLFATLNTMRLTKWRLHLHELTVGAQRRDFTGWTQRIGEWLPTLPRELGHQLEFREDDWYLKLSAVPWDREDHPYPRPILIYPMTSGVKGIGDSIRKPLLHKVSRYPGLSPLVVAVSTSLWDMAESDILAALFGGPEIHLDQDLNPVDTSRGEGGVWGGPGVVRNRHLAGVVIGRETSPGDLNRTRAEFWLNPWAEIPVPNPCPIWETVMIDLASGSIRRESPQTTPSEFFGVAEEWGTEEPFGDLHAARLDHRATSSRGSDD